MLKGFTRKFKPLEILTEEQIQAIHRGTLDILETTGVRVEHDRALEIFADHGCEVDAKEKRVRIPGYLVEECLRRCPSSVAVKTRDPKNDLRIGGSTLYFTQNVGMRYLDLNTWESRPATLEEHGEAIKVLNALNTVAMLVPHQFYMDMKGVSPFMMQLEGLCSAVRNSTKAVSAGYSYDWELFAIKVGKILGIDVRGTMTVSPPLTLYADCCEAGFRYAEAGFPIAIASGAAFGGTGPATLAGSTVTNNAEIIAALVMVQLFRPGTGVIACDFTFPMDMRTGQPVFGAVESALHQAMFDQLWRSYGIPTSNWHAGYSCSKKIDYQAGYEKAMCSLIYALAGDNLCDLHGSIYGEITFHPVMAIIDDDVAGWVGRFIEGVEINDETLAIDLIEKVGPIPGQYLNTEHTRKWWRKEQFIPKVADREPYPGWIKKGKKDTIALAKERMAEILAKHEPKPLTPEQDKAIAEILEEARSFYRQKGLI
jgi:trimethylamine--corrinoid protein Co-methyltransferase